MLAGLLTALAAGCRRVDEWSLPPAAEPPAARADVVVDEAAGAGPPTVAQQLILIRAGLRDTLEINESTLPGEDWSVLRGAQGISRLVVDHRGYTDARLRQLPVQPTLTWVVLRGAPVGDDGVEYLSRFVGLRIVNLPQGQFTDRVGPHLARLSRLELLRIGSARLSDAVLRHVAQCPQLRALHLIDVPVTDRGLEVLASIRQLESFYLDGSEVTDAGLVRLLAARPELHLHVDQKHHDRDPRRGDHPHGE